MAEYVGMPETDIAALTEALKSQQHLLQKLYADLDQEREASSTAADEALSMILRLQGEKSAMRMEANQYKRLAEEKICHAEEALAIFEDLIYQKEMEIASLEFQLQAYRYKLLSLGVSTELGTGENVYPENLLMQNHSSNGEGNGNGGSTIRRINSLPPIELNDFLNKKCSLEREGGECLLLKEKLMIPKPESALKKGDKKVDKEVTFQGLDPEKKPRNASHGNLNSIWEQIKKLDDRVKEISDCSSGVKGRSVTLKGPSRTCSLPPIPKVIPRIAAAPDSTSEEMLATLDEVHPIENVVQEREVFEVPQSFESPKADIENEKKEFSTKWTIGVESPPKDVESSSSSKAGKHDLICDEISEVHVQDEKERVKKMFNGKKIENRLLSRTSTVDSSSREKVAAAFCENQARFQQLWRRMERIEGERSTVRSEISHAAGEEELKLFKDIREQLNLIRSEMHSLKPKQPPPQDDRPFHIIQEAMLHFWL